MFMMKMKIHHTKKKATKKPSRKFERGKKYNLTFEKRNIVYIFISLLLLAHKTTVRLRSHLKKSLNNCVVVVCCLAFSN